MLYMVIEHIRGGDPILVYRRFRDRGRMLPEGLVFHASWVAADRARCFQVMECDDPQLLEDWTANWDDLVDFEIVPVETGAETAEALAPLLGTDDD